MVRAILDDGVVRPLGSLPGHWKEGQELVIDEVEVPPSPEELEAWSRDIEALAAQIPPEDFDRVEAALAQTDRKST